VESWDFKARVHHRRCSQHVASSVSGGGGDMTAMSDEHRQLA
jgi:hypothetical protein